MHQFSVALFSLLLFTATVLRGSDIADVAKAMTWDEYWTHVTYLASDELEGRDTGSKGFDLAAKYTAEKFEAAGLQPFGDDSTYFQKVPFNRAELIEPSFTLTFMTKKGAIYTEYAQDISAVMNTDGSTFSGTGELVFVGYGNIIPEADINDYQGVDVTGKIAVFAVGAPETLADSLQLGTREKAKLAEEQGARGVLLFSPVKRFSKDNEFPKYHRWLGGPRLYISEPGLEKNRNNLEMMYVAKQSTIKQLFRKSGLNLRRELRKIKKGKNRSKALNAQLECSYSMTITNADCKNVVGLLPGTDSLLKDEFVVLGAHLDHVGIGKPVDGDSIRNGLWDNASGSGATISIAETFHHAGIQPKRSIVFINYTGEEKGLYGSHYFANTYCVDSIDAHVNVNIDMLGGPVETSDITPLGYSHSTVSKAIDQVATDLGITLTDATRLEKRFIHRSDQMSYMKLGIPPVNFNQGEIALNPDIDAQAEFEKWMQTRYHKPSDDLNQPYDRGGFLTALKANFLVTYYLANETQKIEWHHDSWVFKKYVPNSDPHNSSNP